MNPIPQKENFIESIHIVKNKNIVMNRQWEMGTLYEPYLQILDKL